MEKGDRHSYFSERDHKDPYSTEKYSMYGNNKDGLAILYYIR